MMETTLYILMAFLISAFIKGVTGLGFSTLCLGILASFITLKLAIPLVLIPSLLSNVLVMVDAGGFSTILRRFWLMYFVSIPGSILGLSLLNSADNALPQSILGTILILYGLWALWQTDHHISAKLKLWLDAPVGLLTGFISGVTGSQLLPVMPYLLSLNMSRESFVQAINMSFTVSGLVMLFGLGTLGLLDGSTLIMSAVGILPVAFGIWLGGKLRRAIPELFFKRIVLGFLVLLGTSLVMRA